MQAKAELIESFYRSLGARDADGMVACYHPDIHFTDEVFDLHGEEAGAMWRMLCERGKDLVVEFDSVEASEASGHAHWKATYTFSATGRKVRNSIEASFVFQDGKIIRHVDRFDFWKWSRQALGLSGLLLGWSGFLKTRVTRTAMARLREFAAQG